MFSALTQALIAWSLVAAVMFGAALVALATPAVRRLYRLDG